MVCDLRRIALRPPPIACVVRGPGDAGVFAVGGTGDSKRRGSQSRKEGLKVLAHTSPLSRPHRSQASICVSTFHLRKPPSILGGARFSPVISGSAQTKRDGRSCKSR